MTITCYILSGKELGRIERFEGMSVLIGRASSADLTLAEPAVSREHARLTRHASGSLQLEDLGSTAGTFFQDERVTRCLLQDGAVIRIANIELRLRFSKPEPASDGEEAGADLELEGEWTEPSPEFVAAAKKQATQTQNPAPAPRQTPTKKRPTQTPAQNIPAGKQRTTSGAHILQYSREDGEAGLLRGDLSQWPGWLRTLAVILAIALLLGLAFGAFQLTQGIRDARADTEAIDE